MQDGELGFAWIRRPLKSADIDALLSAPYVDQEHAENWIYKLAFGWIPSERDRRRAVVGLIEILADAELPPAVRAQAPEGIAAHMPPKHSRLARSATYGLLRALGDPAPEVRFWSVFGLGLLGRREAKHPLRVLLDDTAMVKGWWTVGDEASDMLDYLEGRLAPDRIQTPVTPAGDVPS